MDKARLGFTAIHRRINSCTNGFIQPGRCPISLPSAVATGGIYARHREDGSTFPFHLKR
jgi:hypothetical protein